VSEQQWLLEVVTQELGEVQGEDWGDWLHELFRTQGAVGGSELLRLASAAQRAAAEGACRRVMADIANTAEQLITIAPEAYDYSIRIACDGEFSNHDSGGFFSIGSEEAACEVATITQDILVERWWRVWPTCTGHDSGMHVELIAVEAAWLCRPGRHYTRIGKLASGTDCP